MHSINDNRSNQQNEYEPGFKVLIQYWLSQTVII